MARKKKTSKTKKKYKTKEKNQTKKKELPDLEVTTIPPSKEHHRKVLEPDKVPVKPKKHKLMDKITKGLKNQIGKLSKLKPPIKQIISAAENRIKNVLFQREIYTKGQEPPKSYSFKKKFFGLYLLFFVYSFIYILAINVPEGSIYSVFIHILTFGNPFYFGLSVISFFVLLSLLLSIDEIRNFIYGEHTYLKQLVIYGAILAAIYIFFLYFKDLNLNYITLLLALSMVWLVLMGTRFYIYARKFSTKIESKFISKYSIARYGIALITPFVILGLLVIIAWLYRAFIVFIALDFFGPNNPIAAVEIYEMEMNLIMPLIYFSLVMTLMFIIFEFIFTRQKGETKRAGTFDNFTFSLIVLFIFFFQIFQVSIYLLLRPETVNALKSTVGATSSTVTYVFLFEFIVSMIFLYRIILKLGKSLGWRILFFKKDGLILFFLSCVLAQSLTRFALTREIQYQEITAIGQWFFADKYIISILMIIFLGLTLVIYYMKPHETSMFMRLQKATVKKEDKSMQTIFKILKSEYIRRGEPYPIEIIERELIKATKLSKGVVYSLISRLVNKEINIKLTRERDNYGRIVKVIDFISVTEQFEKRDIAEKKAKRYMSERLFDTISAKKRKQIQLAKNLKEDKATDAFISSLTSDYTKKQKDKEKIRKSKQSKRAKISFGKENFKDEEIKSLLEFLKKEYIYRIENREDYEKIYFPISEVASDIQLKMNINPGQLYRLLEELSENDIELTLLKNKNAPEDKKIAFFPISDDHLCYYLENFRPKLYYKIRREVQRIFNRRIHQTRTNSVISNLKTPIKEDSETAELWKEFLLRIFNYYPSYEKQLKSKRNRMKIIKALEKYGDLFEKGKKKRREKAKGNKGNKGKKSETNKRKRKKRSKN
ncbi:MAG: hypothetical protein ACOC4M_07890 [Promethearchaeia archaeon]